MINTLSGMAIDVEKRRPVLGNVFGGLSGPAIKPVALRMIYQVYREIDLPILGGGGIASALDAVEFHMAGQQQYPLGRELSSTQLSLWKLSKAYRITSSRTISKALIRLSERQSDETRKPETNLVPQ